MGVLRSFGSLPRTVLMTRLAALGWLVVPIAVACETPKSVAVPAASPGTPATSPATDASTAAIDASPTPDPIRVESPYPGGIVVVNDSDAPVGVSRNLPVEREDHGSWTNVYGLQMLQKCFDSGPADCVTIPAHSRYEPLPWTGWLGCSQCGSCRANAPAPIGKYRVVALECPSGVRHEGPAMEIVGDEGRFAGAPHVYSSKASPDVIRIDNDSDTPMWFSSNVEVLQLDKTHNAWDTAPGATMSLDSSCGADAAPSCTMVPPHGSVGSMAFRPGCAPCAKCASASAKPGTYMFRVSICPGSKPLYNDVYGVHFTTEPFSVAPGGAVKAGQ